MEKLITFAVPCYNSAAYMQRCIDTLLAAGEEAEIIIVNDGSVDETAAIADAYAAQYPTIVRAVHKPNGGHGNSRVVRRYTHNFPVDTFFGWDSVRPFRFSEALLMHSVLYRTDRLRASGTVLPEHTFYVDNIYCYKPLPYMQTMYYMDIDL